MGGLYRNLSLWRRGRKPRGTWTPENRAQARQMYSAGVRREEIAAKLGLSMTAINKELIGCDKPRKVKVGTARNRKHSHNVSVGPVVSAACLQDRDSRAAAIEEREQIALRDGFITPVFFGDPPPGYSALDKRRARA